MCPALSIKFKFAARNSKFETSTLRCLDDLTFGICLPHRCFGSFDCAQDRFSIFGFRICLKFAIFVFPGSVIPADAGIQGWRSGACFARKILFVSPSTLLRTYFVHFFENRELAAHRTLTLPSPAKSGRG